jgi:hypothetical protein
MADPNPNTLVKIAEYSITLPCGICISMEIALKVDNCFIAGL